ncbi:hypothetical protein PTSG_02032 [Salpingoeca rosetta]|uniref:Phospholipid/glycerol acyltransferase domain-containing protein n=1 Tax=Salpingoeca rosetta (strain ATCC 50818 / BSB-021) TaxID=946362 RepID=F2TZP0_SALR5|nr:uncharacterized protein PTSG_02032 [Salpingoeca rosetta]EGD79064.1 hypothetical protein PTSG_02032 [Salpingoeca rosetta]|eukprot:XP_004998020.1 hypothetical protein PTSG_02032 [Salpingoeca rosetta]
MLALALVAISFIGFIVLRWCLRHGVWIPFGNGTWVRRWYAPVKESDETLQQLQTNLQTVCKDSIDTVLDYPVLMAKTCEELRKELHNKVILEIYCQKQRKVVGFHMAFWSRLNVHLGLVMIAKSAQKRGLQKLSLFNICMLMFDWFAYRFRISDIGYSSSAFRLFSYTINKSYPNLYFDVKPEKWHYDIAKELLAKHRRDMGVSAEATFDPVHFVVKGSNKAAGGGANALVQHVVTRKSRMGVAAQYLDDLLQPEDEQLYIGDGDIFVFLYRMLPVVPMVSTYVRYLIMFAIFAVHNYLYANASWYASTALKLMRFRHHIRGAVPPTDKPALWVCNHYSYLDALLIHAAVPGVRIIAKKDLADEMPKGMLRDFMFRVWCRGGFMWYDRQSKDATIRERIAEAFRQGQSVVVFSEGTSKRSGPPGEMRPGAVKIAADNGVPIIPVALRYSFPIGVAKGDNAIRNIMSILPMRGIRCGIRFGQPIQHPKDIDQVRGRVTELWRELADDMVYPVLESAAV